MKRLSIGTIVLERRNLFVNNEDAKRFWELFDKDALDEYFDAEDLVYSDDVVNERVTGGNRWQDVVCTIVKIGNRYLAIEWLRGKTEMQENDFDDCTIYEVVPYTKTVTVTDYKVKE